MLIPLRARAAEPPWLEIHSAHFTVVTDAGEKKGREIALRFEQMRSVFGQLLGKEKLNLSLPLTILALKSDKSYYQAAPLRQGQPIDVPGFFLPGDDQNFIVLYTFEEEPWRSVAHDFAHMLLNYNYPLAQGWFDEGLAEYFSSIRVDNKSVEIGADPELRAGVTQDLLENQRDTQAPKSLVELLGAQVWLSIPDLFSIKHDTFTYSEGTHHTMFYAESWILMHYLINQKKLPETGAYFDLVLNQQVPVEEAIQKAYGMSSAQLEQAVKDYLRSQASLFTDLAAARQRNSAPAANPAQPHHFPAPLGPDDMVIPAKPYPEFDARALYADIQIRIPERRQQGLKSLQALASDPQAGTALKKPAPRKTGESEPEGPILSEAIGNELAHRALAWDHITRNEFEEAAAELHDANSLKPEDLWIRYYLSVLRYRAARARHAEMQGLANMMQDLKNVIDWYPEFGDAYDLLALARMEGGGPDAAMQAERSALQLSPREERYKLHLAQIYLAGKQWDTAQALLSRLKNSGNPQIAAQARDLLEQAGAEKKYGPAGASARATPSQALAPQKSPFDILEQDAAQRAASEEPVPGKGPVDKRPTKFVKGVLSTVDCSKPPSAIVTINSGTTVLTLRARDTKSLVVIGADQFSCDWKDVQVSVNYKASSSTSGDLVSLEVH
jgi:hypothetical protein